MEPEKLNLQIMNMMLKNLTFTDLNSFKEKIIRENPTIVDKIYNVIISKNIDFLVLDTMSLTDDDKKQHRLEIITKPFFEYFRRLGIIDRFFIEDDKTCRQCLLHRNLCGIPKGYYVYIQMIDFDVMKIWYLAPEKWDFIGRESWWEDDECLFITRKICLSFLDLKD